MQRERDSFNGQVAKDFYQLGAYSRSLLCLQEYVMGLTSKRRDLSSRESGQYARIRNTGPTSACLLLLESR